MKNLALARLDEHAELRAYLGRYCRLSAGQVWEDTRCGHRIGCLDAAQIDHVRRLMQSRRASLALHDPPYNVAVFARRGVKGYIDWCRQWIAATDEALAPDASLYIWLGADQQRGFQPLADFILMMREHDFTSRSLITMRNQRGYGTSRNWMAVRQELLYYTRGNPVFHVEAEYTDIPKILRGYYKKVNGRLTENTRRGRGDTIRAGNVWVDIQQVFYRMQENVGGCYAQKPLRSAERIISASSDRGDGVVDFFGHAGTTLLACERLGRTGCIMDIEPVYCEIMIRRLENYRETGRTGWQNSNPFEQEILEDSELRRLAGITEKQIREIRTMMV